MHKCSKCVYFQNFSQNFVKSGLCYCDIDMQRKMNTRGHARYVLGALPCLCPKARKEQQARDNARRSGMLAVEAAAQMLLKNCREYVFPAGDLLSDCEPEPCLPFCTK